MNAWTLALLAGFACWVAGGLAASAAPAPNHHASVDSRLYPWSSLAKLFNSVGGSCTGAVIEGNRVLTAGHCVYAFRTHRFLPPEAVHVLLGYDRGDYRVHARVLRYRLGPGYDPEAERRTAAADWVVLELAEPLPADVKPLRLASPPDGQDRGIMLAGFARDRAFVMTADRDCHITGTTEPGGLISHDCMIQPGDSGAPLLRQPDPEGEATIVGVAIGIWHTAKGAVGTAAPLPPNLLEGGAGR